jgi:Mrp family chromosome partitioning ATPase
METPCSWAEVIRGRAPLNEAAVASVEDRLTLFPLTESDPAGIESGDERLVGLLRDIGSHYPLVIVDVGPLGAEDQHPFAAASECPVNAAIVVRDLRFTSERKALATAEQLQQSGIPAVGVAENFKEPGEADA